LRGIKGMTRNRRASPARWPVLAFGTVGLLLGLTAAVLGSSSGGVVPRMDGEAGYELRNVAIAPSGVHDGSIDVTYDVAWADSATYPGRSECVALVRDVAGNTIGSRTFELGSYLPLSEGHAIPVEIKGEAAGASVDCSASARPPANAGYVISDASIELGGADDDPNREPRLTFTVHWRTDSAPLIQRCNLRAVTPEGQELRFGFEISLGNGDKGVVVLPEEFIDGKHVGVSCE
jgi:hypothetical protein